MFGTIYDFGFKILSVTKLSWNDSFCKVAPRSVNALVYRVKGNGKFRFDDGTEITACEGEVFYCPAYVGYDVQYDDGEIVVFHFLAEGLPKVPSVKECAYPNRVKDLFNSAIDTWEEHRAGFYYKVVSIFFDILSVCCSESNTQTDTGIDYSKAVDYLRDNILLQNLSVSAVCKEHFISETGFRKYFRQVYGTSPVKYITEIRVREAEKMLLGTDLKVEEIAYNCGFNDAKYFSRVFSKLRGCSPSEFRKC